MRTRTDPALCLRCLCWVGSAFREAGKTYTTAQKHCSGGLAVTIKSNIDCTRLRLKLPTVLESSGSTRYLEVAVIEFPGCSSQMLQQGALVREGEVEAEVAAVFSESRLPQELLAAGPLPGILQLPLLHLQSFSGSMNMKFQRSPPHQPLSLSNGDIQPTRTCSTETTLQVVTASRGFHLGNKKHHADVASCPATYARTLCTECCCISAGMVSASVRGRAHHIVDEPDAELAVVDVRRQPGRAAAVRFGPVPAELGQALLQELLQRHECSLASRHPLHNARQTQLGCVTKTTWMRDKHSLESDSSLMQAYVPCSPPGLLSNRTKRGIFAVPVRKSAAVASADCETDA